VIVLYRAGERRESVPRRQHWVISSPLADPRADPASSDSLAESRLPPGATLPGRGQRSAETVVYVREGALAYEDPAGDTGGMQAGEFQRTSAGPGRRCRGRNASRTHWAHLFQLFLPPPGGSDFGLQRKRFSVAQRRGLLCLVASADGRDDSLRLARDACVHSTLLDPGQHVVHQLQPGRRAWLHIVAGQASLGEALLSTGDGAGLVGERALSLTARAVSEILLLDLA
jgi:redox-sensitive bicupin YhaK (pirin superfamily)